MIAANLRIDPLVVLVDANGKSSYGPMEGRNGVEPLGTSGAPSTGGPSSATATTSWRSRAP